MDERGGRRHPPQAVCCAPLARGGAPRPLYQPLGWAATSP